ncbi:MAG TPA: hypothetical protein VLT88_10955, partial [Desulfosarcina sp.]|nr:hypothetical protein [Desulfosarcina sp.]
PQLAPHGPQVHYRPAVLDSARMAEERVAALPQSLSVGKRQPPAPTLSRPSRLTTDPEALIQTGPGLPAWQWQSIPLRWNGPVDRTQQLNLWLIPPSMNRLLGFLRVGLLACLIAVFLDLRNWRRHLPKALTGSTAVMALVVIVAAPIGPLRAETAGQAFPPQAILDDLRQRLLEPPPCLPRCADVSRLELAATPDQLRLIMQVHASVATAIPLPATLETWRPSRILLDNQAVQHLARDDRGALWMVLPQGVHQLKLIGSTDDTDVIRLAFPILPHAGTYAGVGWQAQGFGPGGSMDAAVVLTRVSEDRGSSPEKPRSEIPDFFQVTRTLRLGIQWEVETVVRRITAPGTPSVLSIPLLDRASVTTPGIQVQDGAARLSLGPQDTESQFSAALPIMPKLTLTAPSNVPWVEVWILDAATLWRCRATGLTVVHHQDADNNWQPQWRPWPGEQVTIDVTRPEAVVGRTTTVDSARLVLDPGRRFSRGTLTLALRSSKGGQQQVVLPASANLQSVTVNGRTLPIRQDGQLVTFPLEPGSHSASLQWLQLTGAMTRIRAPRIDIGEAAVNAAVTVQMPDNRWILFAGGPRLGPAVLFWSYLVVALLVAAGLGRTTLTPLATHHWLLLALGLTQVPAVVAMVVVGWLLALGYRCRRAPRRSWAFDGVQLLLIILTLAALAGLYLAIQRGLLGIPDMQIAGNESTRSQLNWTQDRIAGTMPEPWVVSLPQWIYHLLMLAWSLWLAFNLVAWLRWGWRCFSSQGLWRPIRWRRKVEPSGAATSEEPPPDTAPAEGVPQQE